MMFRAYGNDQPALQDLYNPNIHVFLFKEGDRASFNHSERDGLCAKVHDLSIDFREAQNPDDIRHFLGEIREAEYAWALTGYEVLNGDHKIGFFRAHNGLVEARPRINFARPPMNAPSELADYLSSRGSSMSDKEFRRDIVALSLETYTALNRFSRSQAQSTEPEIKIQLESAWNNIIRLTRKYFSMSSKGLPPEFNDTPYPNWNHAILSLMNTLGDAILPKNKESNIGDRFSEYLCQVDQNLIANPEMLVKIFERNRCAGPGF
ncbi:hypothetical protein JW968_06565 [Candidatus Woesearchaeota archaeon]|nr:hypothetical protein [Candidatus Woesearchaeota archaeon]